MPGSIAAWLCIPQECLGLIGHTHSLLFHVQEFALKMSAGEAVQCLSCQGKRVRAPSQAAINAAILVAQRAAGITPTAILEADDDEEEEEEEEEEEDEGSSSGSGAENGEPAAKTAAAAKPAKPAPAARPPVAAPSRLLSPEETVLAQLAGAAGCSVHTDATWLDAALRVLVRVLRLECAAEFGEPVDLASFPDYAQDIKQPMDLGTVKVGGERAWGR
jgi:hypothetical protein